MVAEVCSVVGHFAVRDWSAYWVHFLVGVVAFKDGLRLLQAGFKSVHVGLVLVVMGCCCC